MADKNPKKQIILNAFVMNTPGHLAPGLWRHPRNKTDQYKKLSFWTGLAQLLDKAGFHAMFIANTLGPYDVYKGPANVVPALTSGAQFPVNDPLYLVPAMAAVTSNLIFGVTASVTYEKPYALAQAVRLTVQNLRQVAEEEGRQSDHIKIIVGINVIVAATDEDAKARREDYLTYADEEGALALFGGWTGVDLSGYADDEDFRTTDSPRIQSLVRRWSATVPGTDNLPWTKRRIVEYLSVGGIGAKVVGGPKTVADELERWLDISGVDGFNLAHVTNLGTFEDIIEHLLPELRRRGIFRSQVEQPGATAREAYIGTKRLPDDHPGSKYKWRAGER